MYYCSNKPVLFIFLFFLFFLSLCLIYLSFLCLSMYGNDLFDGMFFFLNICCLAYSKKYGL